MSKLYKVPHYKVRLVREEEHEYAATSCGSAEIASFIFRTLLKDIPHEEVVALYLKGNNDIIGSQTLSIGGLHGAALLPADVFRGALAASASAIILGHNHPSGDPTPSAADIQLTRQVALAGDLIGIPLFDHIVVAEVPSGRSPYVSLRDVGAFDGV